MTDVRVCGFCMTGHHENCRPEIVYYDKTWLCGCKCEYNKTELNEEPESDNNDENSEPSNS